MRDLDGNTQTRCLKRDLHYMNCKMWTWRRLILPCRWRIGHKPEISLTVDFPNPIFPIVCRHCPSGFRSKREKNRDARKRKVMVFMKDAGHERRQVKMSDAERKTSGFLRSIKKNSLKWKMEIEMSTQLNN